MRPTFGIQVKVQAINVNRIAGQVLLRTTCRGGLETANVADSGGELKCGGLNDLRRKRQVKTPIAGLGISHSHPTCLEMP